MVYGYCRVSSKGQIDNNSLEQQQNEILEAYVNAEITTEQFTGTTTDRPKFQELIGKLVEGDILVITKLDRFARSAVEGITTVRNLLDNGIKVHILNMGLIDTTPMGKLVFTVMSGFAEFERDMIVERTQTGKAIAKQDPNFKEGRPKKNTPKQIDNALGMLAINGGRYSYKEVAEITGISKSTLIRANNNLKAQEVK